jgi:hypothetical protein
MRTAILLCLLAILLVGCDPVAFRNVSLQLPPPEAQESVTVSADRADVQEALSFVDSIMISNGLVQTDLSRFRNEPELVAVFRPLSGSMVECRVYLKNDTLDMLYAERGRMHSSRAVKDMCNLLYNKLSERYGTERVELNGKHIMQH